MNTTEQALRSDLEETLLRLKALTGFCRTSCSLVSEDGETGITGEQLWGIFSAINDLATTAQAQFYATGKPIITEE
jgi:hypothetical protein